MQPRRFVGPTTALAAVLLGSLFLTGCGDSGNTEIAEEKPITESMKDSMNYMQQKYAKKGGGGAAAAPKKP
ncbi:hypothetical protein [Paludisphaera mucosa]|uniref:Lipoprotein n=1 Tax=Paludisphaera mucosa TaxID=3030827 RepID=A0ABT6FBH0_9BACT|nr:hypothetical protein [Paludisphaera mucosa]MDG3004943.1 hypothetical protein [Paludisphaera mucosa]